MGDRNQEAVTDGMDEMFEPVIGEFSEETYEGLSTESSDKHQLAEKRRRAEQRIEELRLREELGDYDLEYDDY
ncbi:PA3496 family putative envelope integrity protein [Congregibacter sp.]|uniref:PA3496 family putative envelope integrity protein n=1 Tax=Congregibacter sp. TaxID=2744308 RepID=UPI003F6CC8D7